jgi:hypothetical protein
MVSRKTNIFLKGQQHDDVKNYVSVQVSDSVRSKEANENERSIVVIDGSVDNQRGIG